MRWRAFAALFDPRFGFPVRSMGENRAGVGADGAFERPPQRRRGVADEIRGDDFLHDLEFIGRRTGREERDGVRDGALDAAATGGAEAAVLNIREREVRRQSDEAEQQIERCGRGRKADAFVDPHGGRRQFGQAIGRQLGDGGDFQPVSGRSNDIHLAFSTFDATGANIRARAKGAGWLEISGGDGASQRSAGVQATPMWSARICSQMAISRSAPEYVLNPQSSHAGLVTQPG